MNPEANERMIGRCYRRLTEASDPTVQMQWWIRMIRYIKRRTPEQVEAMERARGLSSQVR